MPGIFRRPFDYGIRRHPFRFIPSKVASVHLFEDFFNYTQNPLTGNYTSAPYGGWGAMKANGSNALAATAMVNCGSYRNDISPNADQYIEWELAGTTWYQGGLMRAGGSNAYQVWCLDNYRVRITDALSSFSYGQVTCSTYAAGNKIRVELSGYTFSVYVDYGAGYVLQGTWTDANNTIASGTLGVYAYGIDNTTGTINWAAGGNLGATPAAVNAEPGSFSLIGTNASLIADKFINAESGSFSLTGVLANLLAGKIINSESGSFSLTGIDGSLITGRVINAESGTYSLTGVLTDLAYGGLLYFINAETGTYAIAGANTGLIADRMVEAVPGVYTIAGSDALVVAQRFVESVPGAYVVTGSEIENVIARMLNVEPGSFVMSGYVADLAKVLTSTTVKIIGINALDGKPVYIIGKLYT